MEKVNRKSEYLKFKIFQKKRQAAEEKKNKQQYQNKID